MILRLRYFYENDGRRFSTYCTFRVPGEWNHAQRMEKAWGRLESLHSVFAILQTVGTNHPGADAWWFTEDGLHEVGSRVELRTAGPVIGLQPYVTVMSELCMLFDVNTPSGDWIRLSVPFVPQSFVDDEVELTPTGYARMTESAFYLQLLGLGVPRFRRGTFEQSNAVVAIGELATHNWRKHHVPRNTTSRLRP